MQFISEADYFADEVFKQCRQHKFRLFQLKMIIEKLQSKYQQEASKRQQEILRAADIAELAEIKD